MEVRLDGLTKVFGKSKAVDNLSLTIPDREFLVILGPSGCGKTTTLRMLAGFEHPDEGTISIGDRVVADPVRRVLVPPERRDIGMVFQSYAIWPHLSVSKNVAYPLEVRRVRPKEISTRVAEVLELVGLSQVADRSVTLLSGGQMQRVALARALVYNPKVLLFDEPLSNLDVRLRERLREELKTLQRRTGVTSLFVTHDQTEAVELGDRVVVMRDGRIVESGTPEELWQRPRTAFVADFIGTANLVEGEVVQTAGTDRYQVRLSNQATLLATSTTPCEVGRRVTLAIKPESADVLVKASSNRIPKVRILERSFQGLSVKYTVDWDGLELRAISLRVDDGLNVDDVAYLAIGDAAARVVEA
jgi:iron(III) transport system ATP-binding protein